MALLGVYVYAVGLLEPDASWISRAKVSPRLHAVFITYKRRHITYKKNDAGVPISATKVINSSYGYEEEELIFESDANGNITKVTTKTVVSKDEDGNDRTYERKRSAVVGIWWGSPTAGRRGRVCWDREL